VDNTEQKDRMLTSSCSNLSSRLVAIFRQWTMRWGEEASWAEARIKTFCISFGIAFVIVLFIFYLFSGNEVTFWNFFEAALATALTTITVYIAWKQHNLDKYKVKLELYDRRIAVYASVKRALVVMSGDKLTDFMDANLFFKETSFADFIFDNDTTSYIGHVYKKFLARCEASKNISEEKYTKENGDSWNTINNDLILWAVNEQAVAKAKFQKYLSVGKGTL